MKNNLMLGATALAFLGTLGHFGAKPLLAQIRAALVKNVDEPGRTPYQSTIGVTCTLLPTNFCGGDMTAVPSGKRLVILHVSALLECDSQNECASQNPTFFVNTKGHSPFAADSASAYAIL